MKLDCELCGQPAVRREPALCAECYLQFWSKSNHPLDPLKKREDGAVYSR